MEDLIRHLRSIGVLHSRRIEQALRRVDRSNFVPIEYQSSSYVDEALPIVGGQTISQPYTVVFMLELLEVRPDQRVLEIGLGSGWQAALLAELVGKSGQVFSIEYLPEVYEFAKLNLARYHLPQLEIRQGDASEGWPEGAPFDRIIAAAAGKEISPSLISQLKPTGKMVVPVGHSLAVLEKDGHGRLTRREFPGFVFVPLRGSRKGK